MTSLVTILVDWRKKALNFFPLGLRPLFTSSINIIRGKTVTEINLDQRTTGQLVMNPFLSYPTRKLLLCVCSPNCMGEASDQIGQHGIMYDLSIVSSGNWTDQLPEKLIFLVDSISFYPIQNYLGKLNWQSKYLEILSRNWKYLRNYFYRN